MGLLTFLTSPSAGKCQLLGPQYSILNKWEWSISCIGFHSIEVGEKDSCRGSALTPSSMLCFSSQSYPSLTNPLLMTLWYPVCTKLLWWDTSELQYSTRSLMFLGDTQREHSEGTALRGGIRSSKVTKNWLTTRRHAQRKSQAVSVRPLSKKLMVDRKQ